MYIYLSDLQIIVIISLIETIILKIYWIKIFDWIPENKLLIPNLKVEIGEKLKEENLSRTECVWGSRYEAMKEAPRPWYIYRFIIDFIGVFVGWILLYYTLWPMILQIMEYDQSEFKITWEIVFVIIIGLVGISGKLPIIIDSVQSWFKRA